MVNYTVTKRYKECPHCKFYIRSVNTTCFECGYKFYPERTERQCKKCGALNSPDKDNCRCCAWPTKTDVIPVFKRPQLQGDENE